MSLVPQLHKQLHGICMATNRSVLMKFYSIPPVEPVTTAGDSPDEVAFSFFVYRGCPKAAQWTIGLVTIDLGHVQLDGFSPFSCLRYKLPEAVT